MIVSWNWLTDYVDLDMTVEELSERLALSGLNHESTEEVGGDLAIDLEVTSNRPDCLGHLGVAREIAVLYGKVLRERDPRPRESGSHASRSTAVDVQEPGLCPRFTARVITGAKVGESPWWMRKRLETIGVRPVSNVVDVTNYVMFECGQPLHTYDLSKLDGRRLVVRLARPGEKLVAINGKTYELTTGMLVIADAARPVGLAGVMGGLETEIGESTREILIESARFDAMTVRSTSRGLGLMSPSSYRFERPMDPERTEWASRRCAELILELAGGELHEGVVDVAATEASKHLPIELRFDRIGKVLGIDVPKERAARILESLGLERVNRGETSAEFIAPSWRSDLTREIDLIEEVARIHGYEHIPEDRPVPVVGSSRSVRERVEWAIREAASASGFDEACTFSLVPEELVAPLDPHPVAAPLKAEHSTRKRETALRQSLVPSLLEAMAYNESRGVAGASLFEIANVYPTRPGKSLPDERTRLSMASGLDFLAMKGVVETVLDRLHVPGELGASRVEKPPFAPGRAAELWVGGKHLGYLGEIDQAFLDRVGMKGRASAAELEFDVLSGASVLVPQQEPVPTFPAVSRDLSLVVSRDLPWAELASTARELAGPWLESVTFLDTFVGAGVPEGSHSLHFGLTFRHPERTLTGEEVERSVQAVADHCASRFGASLRS